MINLLPPQEKEKLFLEDKKKLVMISGITIIVPLVCFTLGLLSVYLYLVGEKSSQKIVLDQVQAQYQTPDFLRYRSLIESNNAVLEQIAGFYKKEILYTRALKTISSISRPQNVYFTDLSLAKEGKKVKVIASGSSDTRDNLLLFQKTMQGVPGFQNISFSPDSWINATDAAFHVTFEIIPTG
ncbi:hypothetical protein KW786_03030 [Candidatus Parcubacteria bacterium]|nr:hypothetical protein [Candidatus Parcubacteria bacterium]